MLQSADAKEFALLERALKADTRKGVKAALAAAKKRIETEEAELERVAGLYRFQREFAGEGTILGLDEVGRGPLAGPLAVGGVVLADDPVIPGLNDSKQIPEKKRGEIAAEVQKHALAYTVQYIDAATIDEIGMTASLRKAFGAAIEAIESQGIYIDHILLDGNPLHLDERELNIVKGDAKCASISAASIVAKVARDSLMADYAKQYPAYGFERNKGYGSAEHMEAIRQYGLSPIHRATFCHVYEQPQLF